MTYTTQSGDMWDYIAYKVLGSSRHTDALINANREHVATLIFSAGVELEIPDVKDEVKAAGLPPWKR